MKDLRAEQFAQEATLSAERWSWTRQKPIGWTMLSVQVQKEQTAETVLRKIGVETVALTFKRWKKANRFRQREKVLSDKVLMPGVVFSKLPPSVNWVALCDLKPVRGVVCPNGKPLALDDRQMADMIDIAARLCQKPHHKPMPTNMVFDVGDEAEFITGPLEGYKVKVKSLDGRSGRVIINMFGHERAIETDLATLAKTV